jgi:hypothetical protein
MIYHKLINHQENPNKFGYLHQEKDGLCAIHSKPRMKSSLMTPISLGEELPKGDLYSHCPKKFREIQGKYIILHQRLRGKSNVITHVVKVLPDSLGLKERLDLTDPFVFAVKGEVLAYLDPNYILAEKTSVPTEFKIPKDIFDVYSPKTMGDIIPSFKDGSVQDGRVRIIEDFDVIDIITLLPKPTYKLCL